MADHIATLKRVGAKTFDEVKELWSITAYLYVCFGALIFFKAAILQGEGISFTPWGIAIIKALLLAKFIMIGNALHIGGRFKSLPLVGSIAYQAVAFLLFLLVLTMIEELIVGFFHGRSIVQVLADFEGPKLTELVASCVLVLLILIPYIALRRFDDVLGEGAVARMLFHRPGAAASSGPHSGKVPGA
jgi:hypothetical protein